MRRTVMKSDERRTVTRGLAAEAGSTSKAWMMTLLLACGCSPAAVAEVDAGRDAPADSRAPSVANDDRARTLSNVPVVVDVLANDDARGVIAFFGAASHGAVERADDDTLRYTATAGFVGSDSFTYEVSGSTATVTVEVLPGLGTVADGRPYTVVVSAPPPGIDAALAAQGFFWVDANDRGDALLDFGEEDGSTLYVRWADGTFERVVPPDPTTSPGVAAFGVVGLSGINDLGAVTGWYFSDDYSVAGSFVWTAELGSVINGGGESLDLIATDIDAAGRVVGYTEDYDSTEWAGFVAAPGADFGDAALIRAPEYLHTMLFEIQDDGRAMGTVSNGGDGWYVTFPKNCFVMDVDAGLSSIEVIARPADVFHMDCRGMSGDTLVGKYYEGTSEADRLVVHRAMMVVGGRLVRIDLPAASPVGVEERREELLAILSDGRMFGNAVLDTFDAQRYLPVELTPFLPEPGTLFEDSRFDLVRARP